MFLPHFDQSNGKNNLTWPNLIHFLYEMKRQKETAIFVCLSSSTRFSDDGPQVMLSIIFEYSTLSPKPRESQHNSSMSWVECGMTCDSIFKTSQTSLSKITKLDLDCFAILRTGTVFTMGSSHCTGKDNVHRSSYVFSYQFPILPFLS